MAMPARTSTAIYAHLDDGTLKDSAARAAAVIARAMGYRAEPPLLPDEADDDGDGRELDWSNANDGQIMPPNPLDAPTTVDRLRRRAGLDGAGKRNTGASRALGPRLVVHESPAPKSGSATKALASMVAAVMQT